jgi:hypothetical protein
LESSLGALRFGTRVHKRKNCLTFDRERYRYQQFISEIAGLAIASHHNDLHVLIAMVRDWLSTVSAR